MSLEDYIEKISDCLMQIGLVLFICCLWWLSTSLLYMYLTPTFYESWPLKVDNYIPYVGIIISIILMYLSMRVFDLYLKLEYPTKR